MFALLGHCDPHLNDLGHQDFQITHKPTLPPSCSHIKRVVSKVKQWAMPTVETHAFALLPSFNASPIYRPNSATQHIFGNHITSATPNANSTHPHQSCTPQCCSFPWSLHWFPPLQHLGMLYHHNVHIYRMQIFFQTPNICKYFSCTHIPHIPKSYTSI